MSFVGLDRTIIDRDAYDRNVDRLRGHGLVLPMISELADPVMKLCELAQDIASIDPDTSDPANLFRIHWHNDSERRGLTLIPEHIVLDSNLTGVEARIIVVLGNHFPMIRAHKVLAAYGCLVPRLLSGSFDAGRHRAIWPSTGNYCRGGVAISRILGCRGVAVLPKGMSAERFRWLETWTDDPSDIVRTLGTESNVKEIYDTCRKLAQDPENMILNQFSEFGNYIVHRAVTGPALSRVFAAVRGTGKLQARAFVCASGSAGTLAAGDYLKAELGTDICVVEALECPTLLYNGYGEHNIQGIGDKHVPLIHNVWNSDFVIGVSDRATDHLNLLFNTIVGRDFLARRTGMEQRAIFGLTHLGLSSIANVLGAVKYAKYMGLGSQDAVITVATDGAEMYSSELNVAETGTYADGIDSLLAAEIYGRFMLGATTDHTLELGHRDRERIFNLGYYTWVEQQGIALEDFDARRDETFWNGLMELVPIWDRMIKAFNKA